jgi:hypothetical protein
MLMWASGPAWAQQGAVVALFDIEDKGAGVPAEELVKLTDFLGARLAEGGYRMIPRDEVRKRLAGQKRKSYRSCFDRSCQIELGREMAAQKSLAVRFLAIGQACQVTAEMFDLEQATTELAATEESACGIQGLAEALGQVADRLCRPLKKQTVYKAVGVLKALPHRKPKVTRSKPPKVHVSSEPSGAELAVDGKLKCQSTPCSFSIQDGEHLISMKLPPRLDREEKVQMKAGQKIQWKLDLPYSYLGMDYASVLASLFSVGMDPSDAGYFVLTVIEGVTFLQLHPIVDMGVAVKSFGYRYDGGDSRWSLISFGPAFRAGRLVVKSFLGMRGLHSHTLRGARCASRRFAGLRLDPLLGGLRADRGRGFPVGPARDCSCSAP